MTKSDPTSGETASWILGTRTRGRPFSLNTTQLGGHLLLFGAKGSGKTTTLRVLAEEAARAFVPVIAIDPSGDLARLVKSPTKASLGDREDAARGLSLKTQIEVAPFTPCSSVGLPISLNSWHLPLPKQGAHRVHQVAILAGGLAELADFPLGSADYRSAQATLDLVLNFAFEKGPVDGLPHLSRLVARPDRSLSETVRALIGDAEREELARRLQTLGVGARRLLFSHGLPLDVATLLGEAARPAGQRTRVSLLELGALGAEAERGFFVAEVLRAIHASMVSEPSGTLRALVMIDDAAGFCRKGKKRASRDAIEMLMTYGEQMGVSLVLAAEDPADLPPKLLERADRWLTPASAEIPAALHARLSGSEPKAPSSRAEPGAYHVMSRENAPERVTIRAAYTLDVHVDSAALSNAIADSLRARMVTRTTELLKKTPRPSNMLSETTGDAQRKTAPTGLEDQVLQLIRDEAGLLGRGEVAERLTITPNVAAKALQVLVEEGVLAATKEGNKNLYYPAELHYNPKVGLIENLLLAPTQVSWEDALPAAESQVDRSLFVLKKEQVADDPADLIHFPLWQCSYRGFKTKGVLLFKKLTARADNLYMHPSVPDISVLVRSKGFVFITHPAETNPLDIKDLDDISRLEQGLARELKLATWALEGLMSEKVVRQNFRQRFDVPVETARLIFLPIWEFTLNPTGKGKPRKVWVDAVIGKPFIPYKIL